MKDNGHEGKVSMTTKFNDTQRGEYIYIRYEEEKGEVGWQKPKRISKKNEFQIWGVDNCEILLRVQTEWGLIRRNWIRQMIIIHFC